MLCDVWCHCVLSWDVFEEPYEEQGKRCLSVCQGLSWEGGFLSKQRKATGVNARNQQPMKDQGEIPRGKEKTISEKKEGIGMKRDGNRRSRCLFTWHLFGSLWRKLKSRVPCERPPAQGVSL